MVPMGLRSHSKGLFFLNATFLDVCGCKDDLRKGWTWCPGPDHLGACPGFGELSVMPCRGDRSWGHWGQSRSSAVIGSLSRDGTCSCRNSVSICRGGSCWSWSWCRAPLRSDLVPMFVSPFPLSSPATPGCP
jgi:hypothetical protein